MTPRGALEICQEIADLDNKRFDLERELLALTGKSYDDFIEGVRQLLAPANDEPEQREDALRRPRNYSRDTAPAPARPPSSSSASWSGRSYKRAPEPKSPSGEIVYHGPRPEDSVPSAVTSVRFIERPATAGLSPSLTELALTLGECPLRSLVSVHRYGHGARTMRSPDCHGAQAASPCRRRNARRGRRAGEALPPSGVVFAEQRSRETAIAAAVAALRKLRSAERADRCTSTTSTVTRRTTSS
jgi:hypothetical protein